MQISNAPLLSGATNTQTIASKPYANLAAQDTVTFSGAKKDGKKGVPKVANPPGNSTKGTPKPTPKEKK